MIVDLCGLLRISDGIGQEERAETRKIHCAVYIKSWLPGTTARNPACIRKLR